MQNYHAKFDETTFSSFGNKTCGEIGITSRLHGHFMQHAQIMQWYGKINTVTQDSFYYATVLTKTAVATLSFGAGQPSFPIKSISSTCPRNRMGAGTGRPSECIRTRFRISFSAHVRTILRGLWRQYPRRNLRKHCILTIPQAFMFVKMTIFLNFHDILFLGFKVIQDCILLKLILIWCKVLHWRINET